MPRDPNHRTVAVGNYKQWFAERKQDAKADPVELDALEWYLDGSVGAKETIQELAAHYDETARRSEFFREKNGSRMRELALDVAEIDLDTHERIIGFILAVHDLFWPGEEKSVHIWADWFERE